MKIFALAILAISDDGATASTPPFAPMAAANAGMCCSGPGQCSSAQHCEYAAKDTCALGRCAGGAPCLSASFQTQDSCPQYCDWKVPPVPETQGIGKGKCIPVWPSAKLEVAGAPNRCHPGSTQGCNVCKACCNDFISAGAQCDACVKAKCESPVASWRDMCERITEASKGKPLVVSLASGFSSDGLGDPECDCGSGVA